MSIIKMLYDIFFGTVLTFFFRWVQLDSSIIIITSTNNDSYNFNSQYLFEYIKNSNGEKRIYYVINDDKKRQELQESYEEKSFISNKNIDDLMLILKAKTWISSTFELPIISLIKNKKRVIFHLGHGVPLKNIGLKEKKITLAQYINRKIRTSQFSDVVCYSEFIKKDIMEVFGGGNKNYVCLGQPRNDVINITKEEAKEFIFSVFKNKNVNLIEDATFVLYAPTWRPYSETILFPFSDLDITALNAFLEKENICMMIRSHPFYRANLPMGVEYNNRIINLDSSIINDITKILPFFDKLVTDYSSVFIDYLHIGPIAFIPYDYEKYFNQVGFAFDYEEFLPGPKVLNQSSFVEFLGINKDPFYEKRKKTALITNTKYFGNCKEIYDYINYRSSFVDGR